MHRRERLKAGHAADLEIPHRLILKVLKRSVERVENVYGQYLVLSINFQRQGNEAPNHEAPVMAQGPWCAFN